MFWAASKNAILVATPLPVMLDPAPAQFPVERQISALPPTKFGSTNVLSDAIVEVIVPRKDVFPAN